LKEDRKGERWEDKMGRGKKITCGGGEMKKGNIKKKK